MNHQSERKVRPRLGFLGVGWIGLARMRALIDSELAEVVGFCDVSPEACARARELAPHVPPCADLRGLLAREPDGIVIATPSAQHAEEAIFALNRGAAVFCQKPLARTRGETAEVVESARIANRLLAVDFCYRHTAALLKLKALTESGELGEIFSGRFVFHNAYGPDKAWYRTPSLAGGGCVMDLGIHWVDAALWLLENPGITRVNAQLYARGRRLVKLENEVEDYAAVQLETKRGALVEIACSWNLSAGRDAVIGIELHGDRGGCALQNVNGSFYDFRVERWRGTQTTALLEPPDEWGGRAVVAWARRLAEQPVFDPQAQSLVNVAEILDRIYSSLASPRERFDGAI